MNVSIDVSRLSSQAKAEMIASMSIDIDFMQSDLDYYKSELERKVQVTDEMQKVIDAQAARVKKAEDIAQRMSLDLSVSDNGIRDLLRQIDGLRERLAQPARNTDYEMVMSFLKVSYKSAYHFFTALKAADYVIAARNTPTDIAWELEKIPMTQKIERIKVFRNLLPGLGLKEAKDFIEKYDKFLKGYDCPF